jgi:ribosomal protein L37AE/L43A
MEMKMKRKNQQCPHCENSELYTKSHDSNGSPIWECNLCGHETHRQVRVSAMKRELTKMINEAAA